MEKKGNSFIFNKSERSHIKKLIDKRYGISTSPKDYEPFNEENTSGIERDILDKTKKILSGATVERLVGLTKENRSVRPYTLEIIAEYLQFKNTSEFINHIKTYSNHVNSYSVPFSFEQLIKSHTLIISFGIKKQIQINLLEENKFEILNSQNSRLIKGDIIILSQLSVNDEFICENVIRNENGVIVSFGQYKSGNNNRVISISLSQRF